MSGDKIKEKKRRIKVTHRITSREGFENANKRSFRIVIWRCLWRTSWAMFSSRRRNWWWSHWNLCCCSSTGTWNRWSRCRWISKRRLLRRSVLLLLLILWLSWCNRRCNSTASRTSMRTITTITSTKKQQRTCSSEQINFVWCLTSLVERRFVCCQDSLQFVADDSLS